MATLAVTNDFSAGAAIVASEMNTNFSDIETFVNSTPGVLQLTGGTVTGAVTLSNTLTVGADDTGYDVRLWGATTGKSWLWDEDADKMIVTGTTTLAGATQQTGTLTVGVDDTGHDVKFFGATATNGYMLWDESEDDLVFGSAVKIGLGIVTPDNLLHVWEASAGSVAAHADAQVTIENTGTAGLQFLSNSAEENRIIFGDAADNDIGGITYDHNDNTLSFYASAGKCARFTHNASGGRLTLYGGASSAAEGGEIEINGGTSYTGGFYIDRYGDDIRWLWGGVTKFNVASDGDCTNTNDSYGAISDERLKTDIAPARDYLADLLNLEVVNFVKDKQFVPTSETEGTFEALDTPSIKLLGLIAQQVEPHIAGLIKTDRFGVKSMKYSVLVPMLLQAVQTLTARIVALEAA
jgi:hypothetical protein